MEKVLFVVILSVFAFVQCQVNDKTCGQDSDCNAKNTICVNKKCRCAVGYTIESQRECVLVLGLTCGNDDECNNFPGAKCENNKCTCEAGLMAGINACNQVGTPGAECTIHADCIKRFGLVDDNKECDIETHECKCKASFHLASNKYCRQTKLLRDQCEENDDCFQADSQNNNALECIEENQVRQCKCKEGYSEKNDKCNGSATIFILSSTTLLMVVMAILKF